MKKVLLIIWGITTTYMLYTLGNYVVDMNNSDKIHEELKNTYNAGDIFQETESLLYFNMNFTDNRHAIMEKYKDILSINKDVVGWINISNTKIDYPVVKTVDNDFYLNHNIYKKPSKAGTIFMDFRNKGIGNDKHTILYGHYMKNGSMLADLHKYKKEDFLLHNPIIKFNTLYEDIEWKIFSIYITSVDFYYIKTDFSSINEYKDFLESIKQKSIFDIHVEVSEEDQILTLSTCSYEFENARLVIHAKRI